MDVPATTDATPSVFVTARSAETEIVVFCEAELLAGTGSMWRLTAAVFERSARRAAAVVTNTVITHVAAFASVGRVHVTTWPAKPHAPAGDVTLVTVNCAAPSPRPRASRHPRPPFVTVSV